MKIAIFPGHVGKDSGAIDRVQGHERDNLMTVEAVINGQVANMVKAMLDGLGIRSSIHIGSFDSRIEDSEGSDLGISLHCDSYTEKSVNGYTIFHYPTSTAGKKAASRLNMELEEYVGNRIGSRGIKPHSYYILSKTKFPCLLLEMGFLTSPNDERFLNEYHTQKLIAHAITCFILKLT
jgi:N-acetylmuramoyl-L-alanine amidase